MRDVRGQRSLAFERLGDARQQFIEARNHRGDLGWHAGGLDACSKVARIERGDARGDAREWGEASVHDTAQHQQRRQCGEQRDHCQGGDQLSHERVDAGQVAAERQRHERRWRRVLELGVDTRGEAGRVGA